MNRIGNVGDVAAWRLCIGCGACDYICHNRRVSLRDFISEGIRPVVTPGDCQECTACLDVCPGLHTDFAAGVPAIQGASHEQAEGIDSGHWGRVLELWEGHACDPGMRSRGSSGGVLTALATFCVEQAGMHGVLHTGQDPGDPIRNRTRLSQTRSDLLAAVGSRYSPASVCNGLGLVENAPQPCAIIGQPSEIAAVANARRLRPELERNIGITMSFFCAGSPPTSATVALLEEHKIAPSAVTTLRYRGIGWPGHFAPTINGGQTPAMLLTYRESWGFLQASRPWAVQLWPDGSGELADISCGDPWYVKPDGINPGSSLVVVRTEKGQALIRAAIAAGYVDLKPAAGWKLDASQSGLRKKKGSIWGRRLVLRLFSIPITKLTGDGLWKCWMSLEPGERIRSIVGTFRRVIRRCLFKRARLDIGTAVPVQPAVAAEALYGNTRHRKSVESDANAELR